MTISRLHYTANRCQQMENFPKPAFQKKTAYSMLNILQGSQTFQATRAVCKFTHPSKSSSWPPLKEIWTILDSHLSASHMKFKLQTVNVQKALAHKPYTKAAFGQMAGPTAMSRGNWTAFNPETYPNQNPAFKYERMFLLWTTVPSSWKKKKKINRSTPVSCFNIFTKPGC